MKNLFNLGKGKRKTSVSGSNSVTNEPTPNPNVYFDIDTEEPLIDDIFLNIKPETNFKNDEPMNVEADEPPQKKTRKRTSRV